MFIPEKLGFLPLIFMDLKYYVPLFVLCMFVTARRRELRTKGNKSGSVRKETDNNSGSGVSVDQLQSAQPR